MKRGRNKLNYLHAAIAAGGFLAAISAYSAEVESYTRGLDTCRKPERWAFAADISPDQRKEFLAALKGSASPVRSFSEALAMRRTAETDSQKAFSEYWLSYSLYRSGLIHSAHGGFAVLASRPPKPETAAIQIAALHCIAVIADKYPTLTYPAPARGPMDSIFSVAKQPELKPMKQEVAFRLFRAQLSEEASQAELERTLALLKDGGMFEKAAVGLFQSRLNRHSVVIQNLEPLVAAEKLPASVEKHRDSFRLILSRSYYSSGQFDKSAVQLRKISKQSNELIDALGELAWTSLMAERYTDAIGASVNLQAGPLRKTFAPEAVMVMAMAFNELCLYPESIQALGRFKKNYRDSFGWLEHWSKKRSHEDLYPMAVAFIKKSGRVPAHVASEWIRSPLFLTRQAEINLLFSENNKTGQIYSSGGKEQRGLSLALIAKAQKLKRLIKEEQARSKPGTPLPPSLIARIEDFKEDLVHYKRFKRSAPFWKKITETQTQKAPSLQARLVASINADLRDLTQRMHIQLTEIAENNQLIEVEIYNGASRDILWQNAHPDYVEAAKELHQEERRVASVESYNWGSMNTNLDGDGEVWEDELGSAQANLVNNCASKEKYLTIKREEVLRNLRAAQE